jgi:hypothetical protein
MTAKSTALLYADLGITTSHSRPRVSSDNAFAETAFKTLKYRPEMPDRFGSFEDARTLFAKLLTWYNDEHFHSGIALLTPADVHAGIASTIVAARQRVLDAAFQAHPERFPHGVPTHQELPTESLDQPAHHQHRCHRARPRGGSLNDTRRCLKLVDTFRSASTRKLISCNPTRSVPSPALLVRRPIAESTPARSLPARYRGAEELPPTRT